MDGQPRSPVDRIVALADQCVLCGLCLPHCPTYALDRIEAESPRGRIMQFRALALGQLDATPAAHAHLDHCLGCRNCEPVCPARVRYGDLLVEGRALLRRQRPPSAAQRLLEWLAARPRRLQAAASVARRLRWLLPPALRRRAATLRASQRWPGLTRAVGEPRGGVGLLLGCASRPGQPAALSAAVRVLTRLGWDVHVPPAQGCCGALARHAGDPDAAGRLAGANARAFAERGVECLLVLDSGCVESQRLGATASLPVQELVSFVAADPRLPQLPRSRPPADLALHLPCTQRNVTGGAPALQALLSRLVPGLVLVGERGCCGAAGSHMLLEPDRAGTFLAPLLDQVAACGAATLATGNIGCRLHLEQGLRERGLPVRVLHPIEVLDQCLS